ARWACDTWDACAAEIGAALSISSRRSSGQMRVAQALHTRLKRVFALLQTGTITARTASIICWRTRMVIDDEPMTAIDRELATKAERWGAMSDARLDQAIDQVLAEYDPDALAAFEAAARDRDVQFGKPEDETGTCSMWGRIYRTDAALIKKRFAELTRHLCADDPRSAGERRADALGAMAAESGPLTCRCGRPECAGAAVRPSRSPVVIHVLADEQAITAALTVTAAAAEAGSPAAPGTPAASATPAAPAAPAPSPPFRRPSAVLQGGGIVPLPLLRELVITGAPVAPLKPPPTEPEPGHRPSAALAAFVRNRDMFCRFPGCSTPAQFCDIDHAIAYPAGPTHPSNLRCLCRKNHLLKTFWTGEQGWS
ncbi:HNH endonuclease signature motif containing protein, partial [Mycobacterium sp. ACS4331]|uniref:HNH endonuclease signature motif containing protein n=1 Tax=Mycobacterium sp. ACS4331 TaxID=1834121 RepID=UPI0009EE6CDA